MVPGELAGTMRIKPDWQLYAYTRYRTFIFIYIYVCIHKNIYYIYQSYYLTVVTTRDRFGGNEITTFDRRPLSRSDDLGEFTGSVTANGGVGGVEGKTAGPWGNSKTSGVRRKPIGGLDFGRFLRLVRKRRELRCIYFELFGPRRVFFLGGGLAETWPTQSFWIVFESPPKLIYLNIIEWRVRMLSCHYRNLFEYPSDNK